MRDETLCAGFLLSASNTHRNKNNPKVAVVETGGREIQADIKSGECQQQTTDVIYIHV